MRQTILEEGRQILLEEGPGPGASNLTFKKVFERVATKTGVRITNASVIRRIWDNQSEFQADVLVAIAHDEARPEVGGALDAIATVLEGFDLSTSESRSRALREVCRVGGNASNTAIHASTNWSLWINVVAMATATTTPEQQHRIKAALDDGYRSVYEHWTKNYETLMDIFGMRVREPWTVEQFTMAVTALSEGCSLRQHITDSVDVILRPTGPRQESQEWSLFAVGLEALVHQFFEPDPDFTPPSI